MTSSPCSVEHYIDRLERWTLARLPAQARGRATVQAIVREAIGEASQESRPESRDAGTHAARLMRIRTQLLRRISAAFTGHPPVVELSTTTSPPHAAPPPSLAAELVRHYEDGLNRLSIADQQAIVMRLELGFPWIDVCELLGTSTPAAAQMSVSRALVRLAREMAR